MSLSRDEAREIAATAIILTIILRITSGLLRVIDELDGAWDTRSLLGRFLAPIGATPGVLALALALLIILSPRGAISSRIHRVAESMVGVVAILGALALLNSVVWGLNDALNSVASAMANGSAAMVLGGAAWWMLSNFDPQR